jgi:CHAT domain-containing protein
MLFYLSSSVGATVGGQHLLHNNDYIGIIDALVHAGVPIVLAHRWHVTDRGALQFAKYFYKALLETQSPARAALHARTEIYISDPTNETWMSPILVSQSL